MPLVGTSPPPGTTIRWVNTPAQPTIRPSSKAAKVRSGSNTIRSERTSSGSGWASANAAASDPKNGSISSSVIVR